jgi:APA family basic amino acid/polyamine antiporter
MEKVVKEKYGVVTAASLVVGIVIGSGIFFKADDILEATGGSVGLGVLAFLFVGIGVLFGALSVSYYAQQGSKEGGIIAYSTMAFGKRFGFIAGWFMMAVYFPALMVILAFVAADYFILLTGLDFGPSTIWVLTVAFIVISYTVNILSAKLAGTVQTVATVIKLLPLIIIGLAGVLADPAQAAASTVDYSGLRSGDSTLSGFFIALIAVAFAYDGWIVATSVSAEIKNSKQNLPKALTFGVLGIIGIYVLYFVGMTTLIDPAVIVAEGNAHASMAAEQVATSLGFSAELGSTLMFTAICISVYGGLNGMTLGYLRLPHALVANGLMKDNMGIINISEKYGISMKSFIFGIPFVVFFFVLHYVATVGIFGNTLLVDMGFDISSLPVTMNYVFYIALYIGAIKFIKEGTAPKIAYVYITFAVLISLIVIYGSLLSNGLWYILISLVFIAIGLIGFYNNEELN